MTVRVAMWSGPRNISTAMMRSFGSRADCAVSDEPFYGCFLKQSGLPHPMADAVIASMDCDWGSVARSLSGEAPGGKPVWYQKHMSHHMIGPVRPDDLKGMAHAFLIRSPERIVASYLAKMETVSAEAIGIGAQRAFFDREADRLGRAPPVVDSADVLAGPEGTLSALCAALGIAWDPAMLSWAPGRRASDGVWATHWYGRVEASTGFEPPDERPVSLPDSVRPVLDACRGHYEHLRAFALRPSRSAGTMA